MPEIYEYFGLIFYFYSNEHDPIHVHVKKGDRKMKNILENLSITKSEYIADYTIRLSFSDGTSNDVDFGAYLYRHPHPQYDKYRNLSKFKKFRIENGDIYWGKSGDLIFPIENLYFNNLEKFYEY